MGLIKNTSRAVGGGETPVGALALAPGPWPPTARPPTIARIVAAAGLATVDSAEIAAVRTVDGLAFPAYADWRITGGRTDTVSGRPATTVVYACDDARISYTLLGGTGGVTRGPELFLESRETAAGVVELCWLGTPRRLGGLLPSSPGYVLTFTRDGRTVVLVGRPFHRPVAAAMRRLALASF